MSPPEGSYSAKGSVSKSGTVTWNNYEFSFESNSVAPKNRCDPSEAGPISSLLNRCGYRTGLGWERNTTNTGLGYWIFLSKGETQRTMSKPEKEEQSYAGTDPYLAPPWFAAEHNNRRKS